MRRKLKRLERKKKKEDRKKFFHISLFANAHGYFLYSKYKGEVEGE